MKRVLILILLLARTPDTRAADVLTAHFPEALDQVRVELCFDGRAPDRLFRHPASGRLSEGIRHAGKLLDIVERDDRVRLPALPRDACIDWQVNLARALDKRDYRLIMQRGDDLLMRADLWFWKGPLERDLIVEIGLPAGMSFSTPWSDAGGTDGSLRFRPDRTPAYWESKIAVGRFDIRTVEVPGSRIRLALLGELSADQQTKLQNWIEQAARSVAAVGGSFPQPQPQVLVVPAGHRQQAVLVAHVLRGGGFGLEFYIDETRPAAEFSADWTATHEFSHLLMPYVSSRDRWLSEGLASYYQNVLRARNGQLTEREAWQKLYDGFQRGEKGMRRGTLSEATRDGWRSTMRVYWSGAAIMMMADVQLRQLDDKTSSLDNALVALADCCMLNGETWRAENMFRKLDQLTGSRIFSGLYTRHVNDDRFPDVDTVLDQLGVILEHGRVRLSDDAPLAGVRRAIMSG